MFKNFECTKRDQGGIIAEDVNQAKDSLGASCLYFCSQEGHIAAMEILIENGALIDDQDSYGCTPLFIASQEGRIDAMKLLLKHGADVDKRRDMGCTALYGIY